MTNWPQIAEVKLHDRLALDDEAFERFVAELFKRVPAREFNDADLQNALGYPWKRPGRSFRLRTGEAEPIAESIEQVPADVAGPDRHGARRYPLLAYGSNASPDALARKFAALDPAHRDAFVVQGTLADFDVGVSAHAAVYGSLPATLFASPGTAVDCAVVWVSEEQLSAIAWLEVNYHFGALAGVRFEADVASPPIKRAFVFTSRRGAYAPGGSPVALAGVVARNRTAEALSQRELLERTAAEVLADDTGASAERLLRELFADYARTNESVVRALSRHALPFTAPGWSRYPSG